MLVLIGWLSFKGLTSEDMIRVYADNKIRKIELADGTKVWLNKGSMFESIRKLLQMTTGKSD